jgi:hypothetical protein
VRVAIGDGRARDDVDVVVPDAVGGPADREEPVDHANERRLVLSRLVGSHVHREHERLGQPADDLVAVVREHEARGEGLLRLHVPPVGRQVVRGRQHVEEVEIGNGQHLVEIGLLAGLEVEPAQHLQHVAVDLGGLRGQAATAGLVGRVADDVGGDALHAVVPGRVAEQLGQRDQPVLHVLAGAEDDAVEIRGGAHESLSATAHVVGEAPDARGEQRLLTQDVEHGAVVDRRLGQPGSHDHERVEVRGCVGHHPSRVGLAALEPSAVGQQPRYGIASRQPAVHDAVAQDERTRGLSAVAIRPRRRIVLGRDRAGAAQEDSPARHQGEHAHHGTLGGIRHKLRHSKGGQKQICC